MRYSKSNHVRENCPWCTSTVIGAFMTAVGGLVGIIRAAGMLHTRLITSVLRFPMSFFDTTPKGRIVSRFSKDIDTVDGQIRMLLLILLFQVTSLLVTLIAICFSTWTFLVVSVVVLASFVVLQVSMTMSMTHYNDVIMTVMASQITGVSNVYSSVCSCTDQRRHQSSASLAFVRGIHRGPVNSPHKGPVRRKIFPFDDVIMLVTTYPNATVCTMKYIHSGVVLYFNHGHIDGLVQNYSNSSNSSALVSYCSLALSHGYSKFIFY